ncbi:MAG: GTPase [Lachnospiraceae bacterium]|nr:GTPase [Lachnospiraceae bacterium]
MQEIPIYLFTGFMDSGKTTLVQETLLENGFGDEMSSILIIACEDGDEEYDTEKLSSIGAKVEFIEEEENFTTETLDKLNEKHMPDAVFIEYNGTWEVGKLFDDFKWPVGWALVQTLTTVDSTTFEMYMLNMRAMMQENMFKSDCIIFNRCTDKTNKAKFRATVKAFNRPAQLVYERADGTIDDKEDELPFDITKDEIEISDADYALWFMDCMENAKKYDGKIVSFRALVYNPTEGKGILKPGTFVPGRFAMTCCVEDIQFLGMKAKYPDSGNLMHKSWIDLKARIKNEFAKEYKGKGPVLYPISITPAEKPEDELVYFA